MLRRRHHPQTQAPRETERGQEADEAGGEGGDSPRSVSRGVKDRLSVTALPVARVPPPAPPGFPHPHTRCCTPREARLSSHRNSAHFVRACSNGCAGGRKTGGVGGREQPRNRTGGLRHTQNNWHKTRSGGIRRRENAPGGPSNSLRRKP